MNSRLQKIQRTLNWPPASKTTDLSFFLFLNLLMFWPAFIAASTVNISQKPVVASAATPLGYTISLIMFLFPCALLGWWALRKVRDNVRVWAFWVTIGVLCPIGCVLDFLFGRVFLTFENKGSIIASRWGEWFIWPAYKNGGEGLANWFGGLATLGNWQRYIPIEEILFYTLGFIAMLLIYLWGDSVVFPRHKVDAFQKAPLLFSSFKSSVVSYMMLGVFLFCLAYVYQKQAVISKGGPEVFPGYFLFLLLTAFLPSMFSFPISYHFVNWRALTMAWLFILSISQFWEGTLGVPYQWWGYQKAQMIGIYVRAQCDLPIEAVFVWSLASWATVMVYEFFLAVMRLDELLYGTGRQFKGRMIGKVRAARALIRDTEESVRILKERYDWMGQSKQARARIPSEGLPAKP